jgi:membrane protease YdiL (CAAX protease family)
MRSGEIALELLILVILLGSVLVWSGILDRLKHGVAPVAYVPRLRVPWGLLDILVLVFAWVYSEAFGLYLAVGHIDPARDALTIDALFGLMLGHLGWTLLAIAYLKVRGADLDDLGIRFNRHTLARDVKLGLGGFLAAVPIVYGLQLLVTSFWKPEVHPLAKLLLERPNAVTLAGAAFSAILVAPLSEEMLFRVAFQGWLEKISPALRRRRPLGVRVDRLLPTVLSASIFAAMHHGADRVALFVLALFLGYLYRQTHRLAPSLVAHACVNSMAVIGLWLGRAG